MQLTELATQTPRQSDIGIADVAIGLIALFSLLTLLLTAWQLLTRHRPFIGISEIHPHPTDPNHLVRLKIHNWGELPGGHVLWTFIEEHEEGLIQIDEAALEYTTMNPGQDVLADARLPRPRTTETAQPSTHLRVDIYYSPPWSFPYRKSRRSGKPRKFRIPTYHTRVRVQFPYSY